MLTCRAIITSEFYRSTVPNMLWGNRSSIISTTNELRATVVISSSDEFISYCTLYFQLHTLFKA